MAETRGVQKKAKTTYQAALYLRLSREDINRDNLESNSIRSQRELLFSYLKEQDDIEIYDSYVDDGYSGANFDRPSFLRMMEDIQAKK